jgi:subtilisin family serine protease
MPVGVVRPDSPLGPTKSLARSSSEIGLQSFGRRGDPAPFQVEVSAVGRRDAEDALRDEKTIGVASTMATVLIAPFAADDSDHDANGTTWGVTEVGAESTSLTGEGVTVAILDTGIQGEHVAFKGVDIEQQDFSGDGNGDRNGHGTHCAGTIFGRDVGGTRIGVAPGIGGAFIGKVLRDDGGGDTEMLFKGLAWAIEKGVDVISMSLGFDFPGYVADLVNKQGWPVDLATSKALIAYRNNLRLFDNLMQRLRLLAQVDSGAVVVAASGNESRADRDPDHRIAVSLPAAADGLVSVGALQKNHDGLTVAPFSNTMPRVSAPGVAIKSAKHGTTDGLSTKSGTSMACPHVAGVAALWWESLRRTGEQASAPKVEARLLATVRTDVFRRDVAPLDRGDGLVTAPKV